MGISCEIRLCPSANGKQEYTPGSIISGDIKYYLDEEYKFNKITVSLKGSGQLDFNDRRKQRDQKEEYKFFNSETYVDIDHVINTKEKGPIPIGHYETPFSFRLTENVPPSMTLLKCTDRYKVTCYIKYYVRIKFETPGMFTFSKHFKKDVIVTPFGTPRLETHPLTFVTDKKLFKLKTLFSNKNKLALKAVIHTSVVKPSENFNIDFEIENNTDVVIKAVKVKLAELDRYIPMGRHDELDEEYVDGVDYRYDEIQAGETKNFLCEVLAPAHCGTITSSRIIKRKYAIRTTVVLPVPHINLYLEIPVQIMDREMYKEVAVSETQPELEQYPRDDPPSYWEAMSEENEDTKEKNIFED